MPPLIDPSWEYGYDVDPEIAEILAENAGRGAEEWFGGTAAGFHVGFRSRFFWVGKNSDCAESIFPFVVG
jgi:hypothetical protein